MNDNENQRLLKLYNSLAAEAAGTQKIWSRMATVEMRGQEFDQDAKTKLAKSLRDRVTRLISGSTSFTACEERRLTKLVNDHVAASSDSSFPWSTWTNMFLSKTGVQLRDRARVLLTSVFEARNRRCAYGLGTPARCTNTHTHTLTHSHSRAHTVVCLCVHTHTLIQQEATVLSLLQKLLR